jgi:ADP-heptose:LPS heptosyltransferase
LNSDPVKNILVVRFSSLGDLGLLYPALTSFLHQHSAYTIILVIKEDFAPLFQGIERLIIYPVNTKKYKGFLGMFKLSELLNNSFYFKTVIDAHQVLRTFLLNFFLRINGKKVFKLKKSRKKRNALTRKHNKIFQPLPHATEQYLNIFREAGFPTKLEHGPYLPDAENSFAKSVFEELKISDDKKLIGIAPFAKWQTKVLPLHKMEHLLKLISESGKFNVLLFGSLKEAPHLKLWEEKFSSTYYVGGKGDLSDEIHLMKKLSLLVSMDSANMHLGALAGIRLMTIWGSTHRYAGFGPVNSGEELPIEISEKELTCRPCSVFGDKPCWRGDHACMNLIDIHKVFDEIVRITN